MRENDANALLLDAIKESIARAKSVGDKGRAQRYQQLLDDISSGQAKIIYQETPGGYQPVEDDLDESNPPPGRDIPESYVW